MRYSVCACVLLCLAVVELKADEVVRDPGFFLVDAGSIGVVDTSVLRANRWHWVNHQGRRLPAKVDSFGRARVYELDSHSGEVPAQVEIRSGELCVTYRGKTFRHGSFGHFETTYICIGGVYWPSNPIFVEDGKWCLIAVQPNVTPQKLDPIPDPAYSPEGPTLPPPVTIPQRTRRVHPNSQYSNRITI